MESIEDPEPSMAFELCDNFPNVETPRILVEKKSMGGELSFSPLVRPHRSITSL